MAVNNEPSVSISTNDYVLIAILIFLWLILEFLLEPFGNFPINDDFFYSTPLKALFDEGIWRPVEIASPNAFFQIIWGWLFCLPFGFSYTAAKVSTLTLGIAGTILTYVFLRKAGINSGKSFFAACLLLINPLYLTLSNTFMTDVPFYTLSLVSVYFYLRALEINSKSAVFWGTFFSLLATLNRQFGIVIPAAYGITYLIRSKIQVSKLLKAFLPLILISAALLAYIAWITNFGNSSAPLIVKLSNTPSVMSRGIIHITARVAFITLSSAVYLGIFLSPILFYLLPGLIQSKKKHPVDKFTIYLLFTLGGFLLLLFSGRFMPLLPNNIIDFGIGPGPTLMRDGGLFWPKAPALLWFCLSIYGLFFAAVIFDVFFMAVKQVWYKDQEIFSVSRERLIYFLVFSLLYLPLISIIGPFDRYVIPFYYILFFTLLSIKQHAFRLSKTKAVCYFGCLTAAICLTYFSVCGAHDLFALYTAKQKAVDKLIHQDNVPKSEIDGGLEFNGWPEDWEVQSRTQSSSWWNVVNDTYVITLGPLKGYEILEDFKFKRWLFMDIGKVYILKRTQSGSLP